MSFPWLFLLGIAILSSHGWWPTLPIFCFFFFNKISAFICWHLCLARKCFFKSQRLHLDDNFEVPAQIPDNMRNYAELPFRHLLLRKTIPNGTNHSITFISAFSTAKSLHSALSVPSEANTVKPRYGVPAFNIILLIKHINFNFKKHFHSY